MPAYVIRRYEISGQLLVARGSANLRPSLRKFTGYRIRALPRLSQHQWCHSGIDADSDFQNGIDLSVKVSDIIRTKSAVVKTVRPESSARELSVRLHADQIGAMVVSSDGKSIDGIVTERDLAYGLAAQSGPYGCAITKPCSAMAACVTPRPPAPRPICRRRARGSYRPLPGVPT